MGPCRLCMGAMSHCYRNYGKAFFFCVFWGPNGHWKRNAKKTPKELGADERFEDVPTRLSDKDRYGKVNRVSTSTIQHMRGGSTFEE